jgi:Ca-activated chloride channel family protein
MGVAARHILRVTCLMLAIAAAPGAQNAPSDGALTIVSPRDGEYVVGQAMVRARVDPGGSAPSVSFYVDGRQVCVVARPPYNCRWDAGRAVTGHQVRVVANWPDGTRLVHNVRTRGLAYADSANVDVVQVTVTVGDGRGHYVKGLPQSAFHIREDGRPQDVTHFQSEDVPLDLLVALDISNSMTAAMPKLKEASKDFLNKVAATDTVTVVGFNDSMFTLTRRSTDPEERTRAIDRLAPWGATALYDVIISAVETLGAESGRKSIVVFTDGEDQGSRAQIDDVEATLQESDVTLYMIGQGRGTSADPMKRVMRRLAEPTGGRALFTEDIDELREAFAELLEELSNQYLLGYIPTNSRRDGTLRSISVEVDGHSAVRARRSYRLPVVTER